MNFGDAAVLNVTPEESGILVASLLRWWIEEGFGCEFDDLDKVLRIYFGDSCDESRLGKDYRS